jgi:hypothetical protein
MEAQAPTDPRTAAIDGVLHIIWVQTQNNPDFQPPELYERDMQRLKEEWRNDKEVWQPETRTPQKKS